MNIPIYKHLYLYNTNRVHTVVSSPNSLLSVAHSGFLSYLLWNLPLQQWETWLSSSAIHLMDSSIPMCRAVPELTCTPQETPLATRVQALRAIPFAFSLTNSTHFQRCLGQHCEWKLDIHRPPVLHETGILGRTKSHERQASYPLWGSSWPKDRNSILGFKVTRPQRSFQSSD